MRVKHTRPVARYATDLTPKCGARGVAGSSSRGVDCENVGPCGFESRLPIEADHSLRCSQVPWFIESMPIFQNE
jgi:hypothetical protein